MSDHYEFFEQLRRGAQRPSGTLYDVLHRIPPEPRESVGQVRRLLNHVVDEVSELVQTVENIMRWHGRDQILPGLSAEQQSLLAKLREIAPDELPEE